MAKDVANPLPAGARRINPVFQEWRRRIGEPDAALREFNRALADGRLVAWIPSRGVLPPSYWQTAQVAFDSVDPLCVIVRRGKREVRSGFYIAEAALPVAGDAIAAVAVKEAGDMGRRGDIAKGVMCFPSFQKPPILAQGLRFGAAPFSPAFSMRDDKIDRRVSYLRSDMTL